MFKIGSKVVYPTQGAGKIIDIIERTVLGKKNKYYKVKLNNKGMTMFIPVDTIKESNLRPVISKKKIDIIVEILKSKNFNIPDDWRDRYNINSTKVKEGTIENLAEVTRDLYRRNKKKELSIMERKLFENAYTLLTNEIALSRNIDLDEAEDFISNILDNIFLEEEKEEEIIAKKEKEKLEKVAYDDTEYEYDDDPEIDALSIEDDESDK